MRFFSVAGFTVFLLVLAAPVAAQQADSTGIGAVEESYFVSGGAFTSGWKRSGYGNDTWFGGVGFGLRAGKRFNGLTVYAGLDRAFVSYPGGKSAASDHYEIGANLLFLPNLKVRPHVDLAVGVLRTRYSISAHQEEADIVGTVGGGLTWFVRENLGLFVEGRLGAGLGLINDDARELNTDEPQPEKSGRLQSYRAGFGVRLFF